MTPEERERRIRILKAQRAANRRKQRRKALIMRGILAAVILLIAGGVIALIVQKVSKSSEEKENHTDKTQEAAQELEAVDTNTVLHLSFQSLIASPETAFGQEDVQAASRMDQSRLTVEEFQKVLQQLYDQGYILVSIHDLRADQELFLPKGKKPLILSQQDVSYELELLSQGTASKLIVGNGGKLVNERQRQAGDVVNGSFDVVTCVEDFVTQHPDFSHEGARGILGLTGYNGILGYRTSAALGSSTDNRYAGKYGIFDTAAEVEAVKPVIQALKEEGWEFACNGYGSGVSYADSLETIKADMKLWKEQVESLVGKVDVLLFPAGSDISTWSPYDPADEKYAYLKKQGFQYFCAQDLSGNWLQLTDEYLRCNYLNLDGYRMAQDLHQGAGRFSEILNFEEIYDQTRPSAGALAS